MRDDGPGEVEAASIEKALCEADMEPLPMNVIGNPARCLAFEAAPSEAAESGSVIATAVWPVLVTREEECQQAQAADSKTLATAMPEEALCRETSLLASRMDGGIGIAPEASACLVQPCAVDLSSPHTAKLHGAENANGVTTGLEERLLAVFVRSTNRPGGELDQLLQHVARAVALSSSGSAWFTRSVPNITDINIYNIVDFLGYTAFEHASDS